jgi:hypothetical protein
LAGDESVLNVFWGLARRLDKAYALELRGKISGPNDSAEEIISDLFYIINGVKMKFVWDPLLSSDRLHNELKAWRSSYELDLLRTSSGIHLDADTSNGTTSLVLVGTSWKSAPPSYIELTRSTFNSTMREITDIIAVPPTTFGTQRALSKQAFVAPVPVPFLLSSDDEMPPTEAKTADGFNDQLRSMPGVSAILWSYLAMNSGYTDGPTGSEVSFQDSAFEVQADILLNFRCNAIMDEIMGFPFDRTCCSSYMKPSLVQQAIVLTLVVLTFAIIWRWRSC